MCIRSGEWLADERMGRGGRTNDAGDEDIDEGGGA